MTRVVFLGTPEAAVPTLRGLSEHHDVALVVTRPDRGRGRGRPVTPTPVKEEASRLGLDVAEPASSEELLEALSSAGEAELGVVVAYGRILRPDALDLLRLGMLNVHFSLLPRWRGAAPVARALMAGDPMTGVTIIRLDEGLDTGPVLTAQAIDIGGEEVAGDLGGRLAGLGARLLLATLPGYVSGEVEPVPQSDEGSTYAQRIEPEERTVDIDGSSKAEVNRVRGLSPEPGAVLVVDGEPLQVLGARRHDPGPPRGEWRAEEGRPVVGLAGGGLELVEVLPPGKRAMSGEAWMRGKRRSSGTVG